MYHHLSIQHICRLFGKSRQGWHYHQGHQGEKQLQQEVVLSLVRRIRSELPKLGGIKLRFKLAQELDMHHIRMGRDSFFKLLRENKLLIKPKRRYVRTTNSNHHYKIWPDLVNRRAATMPEEIWVSDITYLRTKFGFAYLDLITDAFSRKIIGYHLSKNLKAIGCMKAFKMAHDQRIYPQRPLIHHSDRGIQYCCDAYVQLLKNHRIEISMTQTGSPYDNAIAERVNGILKTEFELHQTFNSFEDALEKVHQAIDKYNNIRPHFSCEMQTPQYRHAQVKPIQEYEISK